MATLWLRGITVPLEHFARVDLEDLASFRRVRKITARRASIRWWCSVVQAARHRRVHMRGVTIPRMRMFIGCLIISVFTFSGRARAVGDPPIVWKVSVTDTRNEVHKYLFRSEGAAIPVDTGWNCAYLSLDRSEGIETLVVKCTLGNAVAGTIVQCGAKYGNSGAVVAAPEMRHGKGALVVGHDGKSKVANITLTCDVVG